MVPVGHAGDGGGSIRIPASECGLVGLKPSRARVPLGPEWGDVMGGLVCELAVTRSVRDTAAVLDAVAGPAPGDPYAAPTPARPFLEEVGIDPGRLRIGMQSAAFGAAVVDPSRLRGRHRSGRCPARVDRPRRRAHARHRARRSRVRRAVPPRLGGGHRQRRRPLLVGASSAVPSAPTTSSP